MSRVATLASTLYSELSVDIVAENIAVIITPIMPTGSSSNDIAA